MRAGRNHDCRTMPSVRRNQARLNAIQRDPPCIDCGKRLYGEFYGPWPACSLRCYLRARWRQAQAKGDAAAMQRFEDRMREE